MASALQVFSKPSLIDSEFWSLNDFPDEIILKILSFFGAEDLIHIISKVCERWNALSKELILWKNLSYSCYQSSDINRVAQVLINAPALYSLNIHNREDAADILQFHFHIRGYLRKLFLEDCYIDECSIGLLANNEALYPNLEVLSLKGCYPLPSSVYHLIPRLKKLTELNISYCLGISGKTLRIIADSCQHLKKLRLRGETQIEDDDVIHIIKKLGHQLTTLALEGERLTDVAYLYLKNCARLQELEVLFCEEMTDRGLLEGIGSLHEITSLCLHLCLNLTAKAWSMFLHRPSMNSIKSLLLSACFTLDDEGLKGIAERCKYLNELVVDYCCNVTDAGVSLVISQCNQLRVLKLMDLPSITGAGWLALVPSHIPHLRLLRLEGSSNVRDDYVEELVVAVPELQVFK